MPLSIRAAELHDALPQTQCTRCGYPDCQAYAQAIDVGQASVNQCPPGGAQGIARLARIMGCDPQPLNLAHGQEAPRQVAWIDEGWCIGCTLCIKACPVDAIVGASKLMHTVIEEACTGCELCIPVCPVDCIVLDNASGAATGWQAWSPTQAAQARQRYEQRGHRLAQQAYVNEQTRLTVLEAKVENLASHSQIEDPQTLERKKSAVAQALAKARAKAFESGQKD
jgi:Na+-translocating ferredoxin:NAD+ oxidoreductase subunit B